MKLRLLLIPIIAVSLTAPLGAEINRREKEQQKRIAEGAKDHELTAKEIEKLELAEARIKWQERKDRLEHGGRLTRREKIRLNRELELLSHRIHREKERGKK